MKLDIIFAGVGGQGIVSAASMFTEQVDKMGFHCKQNEVHGMAQRGGAVVCHVRVSSEEIMSDIIPEGGADIILSAEPMEALRYMKYLSAGGRIISSNTPVKNIEYPDVDKVLSAIGAHEGSVIADTQRLIEELKNERAANIAMLGALVKAVDIKGMREGMISTIEKRFAKKGSAVVEMNLKAFEFGERAVA